MFQSGMSGAARGRARGVAVTRAARHTRHMLPGPPIPETRDREVVGVCMDVLGAPLAVGSVNRLCQASRSPPCCPPSPWRCPPLPLLTRPERLRELFGFVWHRKAWWMMPPLLGVIIIILLVTLTQGSALAPLIYPLF